MSERVTLRFRGLRLERFLQRALENEARFESVERKGAREALLVTDARGAEALNVLARRFALDVTEISRGGPGAILRRLQKRWTLGAALLVCGLLSCLFLSRLWIIEVRFLDGSADKSGVFSALHSLGAVPGAAMREIDPKRLALSIQSMRPELSYVGARARGVRLLVEATYALPAPDIYNPEAARDLVASRDALLVSLDVMSGTAAAKPGQVVRKGQVLIRGEERDGRETTRGVCALGSAMARVWTTGEAEAHIMREAWRDTGNVRRGRRLELMGWTLPVARAEPYPLERLETRETYIGGMLLPLRVQETLHIEREKYVYRPDERALREEIAKIAIDRALSEAPEGVSPVDKWVDYSMIEGEIIRARAAAEFRLNIAVSREALVNS